MNKVTTNELLSNGFVTTNGKWSYSGKPCVLKFSAEWCAPCKSQEIILQDLSKTYTNVSFYSIDVEEEYELAEMFSIRSLPTIIICNGSDVKQFVGLTQKQKLDEILKTFTEVLV